jgi:hypothetical protein
VGRWERIRDEIGHLSAFIPFAKDGKVVCFFSGALKFKSRLSFGFNDAANLDEGAMWPVAFALEELTAAEEEENLECPGPSTIRSRT